MHEDFTALLAGPDFGPAFAIFRPGAILRTTQDSAGRPVEYDVTRYTPMVHRHATGRRGTAERRNATFYEGVEFLEPRTVANNLVVKQLEELLNFAGRRSTTADEKFLLASRVYDLAATVKCGFASASIVRRLSEALSTPVRKFRRGDLRKQVTDRLLTLASLLWTAATRDRDVVHRSHRAIAASAGYDKKRNTKATWNAVEDLRALGLVHVLESGEPGAASRLATVYEVNSFGVAAFLIHVLRGEAAKERALTRAGKTARDAVIAAFLIDTDLAESLSVLREARRQLYLATLRAKDWCENRRAPDHILAMSL